MAISGGGGAFSRPPLYPLTISCFSKSRLLLPFLVLPFWYLLTRVVPDKCQNSSKTIVCVCVVPSQNSFVGAIRSFIFQVGQAPSGFPLIWPLVWGSIVSSPSGVWGILELFKHVWTHCKFWLVMHEQSDASSYCTMHYSVVCLSICLLRWWIMTT